MRRLIEAAGAEVRYLPAYSPEYNPIEKDQADSTSSDGWCAATDAGYHRLRPVA
ncbi:transposase [Singulisphaera sp. PoT]|uniref:transposase n=1 Tax=Singulisphaera sp. PoT TaxID=3411797 RepID=UPI003BF4B28A